MMCPFYHDFDQDLGTAPSRESTVLQDNLDTRPILPAVLQEFDPGPNISSRTIPKGSVSMVKLCRCS
ncbi:unnamed protein product [Caretta caretta]